MDRRGVLLLMFDVPMGNREERRDYAAFRKLLRTRGFRRMQESVYVKLFRNLSLAESEITQLDALAPDGNILILPLTLRQFGSISTLRGESFDLSVFSDDVLYF